MRALVAIVVKDLKLLVRDRTGFFFALIFPLLMAVFFGAIFSGGSGDRSAIDVVLVDEDQTDGSARFVDELEAIGALVIRRANSRAEALSAVRRGERTAYLVVPPGFAAARAAMFAGDGAAVIVGVDPSRRAEAAMLEAIISRHLYAQMAQRFGGRGLPDVVDLEPVTLGKRPPSYFAISFPQGIVWGLMMCAMTFGMALVTERERGTLMRLRVAPISRAHILAGKAGACAVMVLVVQLGLLGLGAAAFDLEIGGALVLAMAVLASAACFVGLMMLLSILGRTEKAASGYATAALLVMMMLGGGMVPLFFMPEWMQTVGHVSPVKWALLALEGATWRELGPAEMAFPCAILLAVGAAGLAIGAWLFRD